MDTKEFDKEIRRVARKLSGGNTFLAEELIDKMQVTILAMSPGREHGFYTREAIKQAIDHLKVKVQK